MVPMVPEKTAGGNTNNPRPNPAIRWCFTLNNYTNEEYDELIRMVPKYRYYIIGKEKGESGTPHLQGYIEFNEKVRPLSVINNKKIHWEKAKGDRKANYEYCSKGGDFVSSEKKYALRIINNLRKWQCQIVDMINKEMEEPNDRLINWIYDKEGGKGKTALIKYLDTKYKCVISTVSNKSDCATLIRGAFYDEKDNEIDDINKPWIMLFNFQKDYKYDSLNYDTLEAIKDGLITATKYRGRNMNFNPPIMFIMANEKPLISINNRIKLWGFNTEGDSLNILNTASGV